MATLEELAQAWMNAEDGAVQAIIDATLDTLQGMRHPPDSSMLVGLDKNISSYEALLLKSRAGSAPAKYAAIQQALEQNVPSKSVQALRTSRLQAIRTQADAYQQAVADALSIPGDLGSQVDRAKVVLTKLQDQGITGFKDKAGRNWSLAAYADMATRTGMQRVELSKRVSGYLGKGRTLVIVSDAPEECPVCRLWEGRILSIASPGQLSKVDAVTASKIQKGYPTIEEAMAAGLMHPGCRHDVRPFISEGGAPDWDDRQKMKDPEGGAARVKQRYLERQVRRIKRHVAAEQALMKHGVPHDPKWNVRLAAAQKALNDHIEANGLKSWVSAKRTSTNQGPGWDQAKLAAGKPAPKPKPTPAQKQAQKAAAEKAKIDAAEETYLKSLQPIKGDEGKTLDEVLQEAYNKAKAKEVVPQPTVVIPDEDDVLDEAINYAGENPIDEDDYDPVRTVHKLAEEMLTPILHGGVAPKYYGLSAPMKATIQKSIKDATKEDDLLIAKAHIDAAVSNLHKAGLSLDAFPPNVKYLHGELKQVKATANVKAAVAADPPPTPATPKVGIMGPSKYAWTEEWKVVLNKDPLLLTYANKKAIAILKMPDLDWDAPGVKNIAKAANELDPAKAGKLLDDGRKAYLKKMGVYLDPLTDPANQGKSLDEVLGVKVPQPKPKSAQELLDKTMVAYNQKVGAGVKPEMPEPPFKAVAEKMKAFLATKPKSKVNPVALDMLDIAAKEFDPTKAKKIYDDAVAKGGLQPPSKVAELYQQALIVSQKELPYWADKAKGQMLQKSWDSAKPGSSEILEAAETLDATKALNLWQKGIAKYKAAGGKITDKGYAEEMADRAFAKQAAETPTFEVGKPSSMFKAAKEKDLVAQYERVMPPAPMRPARYGQQAGPDYPEAQQLEYRALRSYTGSGYTAMNDYLRGYRKSGSANIKAAIEAIDRTMARSVAPSDMLVHRNVNVGAVGLPDNPSEENLAALVGQTIKDKGFVSTSIKKQAAEKWGRRVMLNIEVPKGTQGIYVRPLSDHKSEWEFLLPRDTSMVVKKVVERMGAGHMGRVVEVTVQVVKTGG